MTQYTLEFIGRNIETIRTEQIAFRDETLQRLEKIEARLAHVEKGQQRFHVRQAVLETRQNDMTADLAAIAKIIERAGLVS